MTPTNRRLPLELRIPPPLVAGTAALAQWLVTKNAGHPAKARQALAAGLIGAGVTIGARGILHFDEAGTTFHPHHPETSTSLVTTGVYGRTRNPMYLGMALGLLGIAVYRGRLIAIGPIVGYAAFLQKFQIRPEEEALRTIFGSEYDEYARRVRRWV